MKQIFFVTGTDTDAGKTYSACALLHHAQQKGLRTLGLKPLASGAQLCAEGLRNEDALALMAASSIKLPYEAINPFCFAEPIAPHIAAAHGDVLLSAETIAQKIQAVLKHTDFDYALIEGAGGWRTPINNSETLADVVKILNIPVILVVGLKLGCLNHALLTREAILADGLPLHGWIANDLAPMPVWQENVALLRMYFGEPLVMQ